MQSPLDPPAHVRTDDRLAEMPKMAKAMYAAIEGRDGKNLEEAVSLGRLLVEIKKNPKLGKYLDILDDAKIPHQRASEFTRIAKLPAPALAKCASIRDACRMLLFIDGLCVQCRQAFCVRGAAVTKNCDACKKVRKQKKMRAGDAILDWKAFESHYQFVNQTADVLAHHYPEIKNTPAWRAWADHLNAIITIANEWHKELIKGK